MNARELLERLVRIPSTTGNEDAVVAFLQDQATQDGLRVRRDAVGNFIAEAGHGPRHVLFVGHVDTVPGDIPVFEQDGELWGRGTVDAKGPLAAAHIAALRHLDDEDLRITVVGAVGEEEDSRGAKALEVDRPDAILIGEPSGWDGLTIGYKGILRGSFSVEADTAHGGHPGPNTVDRAVARWQEATALHTGYGFGDTTLRLDRIASHHDGVRDRVEAGFQVRLPPGRGPVEVQQELERVLGGVVVHEAVPAVAGDRRTPLSTALRGAIRAQGGTPRVLQKTGTADLNLLAQRYPSVPIAAYGPGDSALDHAPDERIVLAELDRAVEVLDGALGTLGRMLAVG